MKHLSSKVDLLDYKAHDHNKIMHRERDEHIATGRALSPGERTTPSSSWESATVMKMAMEIDGDGSGGTSLSRKGAGTKDFMSPKSSLWWRRRYRGFRGFLLDALGFLGRRLLIGA